MFTYHCGDKEGCQGNTNHRRDNVDKPVWQEWSYPQENNVIDKIVFVSGYLIRKITTSPVIAMIRKPIRNTDHLDNMVYT